MMHSFSLLIFYKKIVGSFWFLVPNFAFAHFARKEKRKSSIVQQLVDFDDNKGSFV